MADTIHVRPQPGLKYRRPDTKQLIGEEGFHIDASSLFAARALQHGDLVLVEEAAPTEPEPGAPAGEPKTTAKG